MPGDFYEQALSLGWIEVNTNVFGRALVVPPTIRIDDVRSVAATWNSGTRTIRFSRDFVTGHPWSVVLEVLKHEMAHQYVSDVLGVEDETAHGPAFHMICERYGIDGRASVTLRSQAEEHTIDRIKKLLQLGTSPNEHEARSALAKAQRMMDEHGLHSADLDGDPDGYGMAVVGPVVLKNRPLPHHSVVSAILSEFFGVRCIWAHGLDGASWGLQLEICGLRKDLAIAEHVYEFLLAEAARLWERQGMGGKRDREDFFEGVMRGFLAALREEARARAGQHLEGSRALVRTSAKARLDEYFERRNPRRSALRGRTRKRGAKFLDGVSEGGRIKVHSPVTGSGPKLLGGGSR